MDLGDEKLVETLIKAGANVSNPGEDGRTPLHQAAAHGYTTIVDMLLKNGANVNALDDDQNTPLHSLGRLEDLAKQFEIAELLVNAGADVNAENEYGRTPSREIFNSRGMFLRTSFTALVIFQKNHVKANCKQTKIAIS